MHNYEKPNGIVIVGYPVTGKTTVAEILKNKHIPDSQVIDKSQFLTYIPLKIGYNQNNIKNVSLDEFIDSIVKFDEDIPVEFKNSFPREITVEYSDMLRKHFKPESGYNYKVVEEVMKDGKFPIIAGPRYIETVEHFANKGFAIYELILSDEEERQKRTHDIEHNGVYWGPASYQLNLERKYFDIDKIHDFIRKQENKKMFETYDTSNINPEEIAKVIALNLKMHNGNNK